MNIVHLMVEGFAPDTLSWHHIMAEGVRINNAKNYVRAAVFSSIANIGQLQQVRICITWMTNMIILWSKVLLLILSGNMLWPKP